MSRQNGREGRETPPESTAVSEEESKKPKPQPAADPTKCAKCGKVFRDAEIRVGVGLRFHHLACWFMKSDNASMRPIRREEKAKRADREARADAAAEESMRGHKPSDWRVGKSPSDYGR